MKPRTKLKAISACICSLSVFINSLKLRIGLTPEIAEKEIMGFKPKRFSELTADDLKEFDEVRQTKIEELKQNFPTKKELIYNNLKKNIKACLSKKEFGDNSEGLMAWMKGYRPIRFRAYDQDDLNEIKISLMKDYLSPEQLSRFKKDLADERAQFEEKLMGERTEELKPESEPEPDNFSSQEPTRAAKRAKLSSHVTDRVSPQQSEELRDQESASDGLELVSEEKTSMYDKEVMKYDFLALIKHFPGLMFSTPSDDGLGEIHSKLSALYQEALGKKFESKFTTKQKLRLFEDTSKIKVDMQDLIVGLHGQEWIPFSRLKEFDALKKNIEVASKIIENYFQENKATLNKKDGRCIGYGVL